MKLFEMAVVEGIQVLRDAQCATLGFFSDPQPGMLGFLESSDHLPKLQHMEQVAAVITTPDMAARISPSCGLAVAGNPRLAFFQIHNYLATHTSFYWQDFPTWIDPTAQIHPQAHIAERNVRIGPRTVIEPTAVILERTQVGADCLIRAGAVLGCNGFQIARDGEGTVDLIHAGGVLVEDNAQILANAAVAAAVFRQFTRIGTGVRIGTLAFVSHNVQVGRRALIGHGCVVNGNVVIGDDVWIGPGASIANNVVIGKGAAVSLGSAVIGNVAPGSRVTGNVAMDHRKFLRRLARKHNPL